MSKYVFSFNKETSKMWDSNPKYNEMFIQHVIQYLKDVIKIDGVIFMKEALVNFGFDTKKFDIETLSKYWNEGDVDITFIKEEDSKEAYNPKPNAWLIKFITDN